MSLLLVDNLKHTGNVLSLAILTGFMLTNNC